ncbi:MAG: PAS domain S-box protein [Gluconacetobacter diazotrophicus]|nr:PAS domain S-box protein [Gluconacetobacter diazotrophicus]
MAADPPAEAAPEQLRQIIAALTEGVVLVGSDGTLLWADDTALALHGVRRLRDLGGTVSGYAKRYRLTYVGGAPLAAAQYPLRRLLDGHTIDRATVEVTRRKDDRRWVHEVRTKVLPGADGEPDCLVLILDDETERYNAEQRFERAFAANPAPAIIARLADGCYVKVNHGFLELTGWRHHDLIGRSLREIDVLQGAEKRDLALARLRAGDTIPQMESRLPTASGGEKTVLLGGQPIEIGDENCMLFTFADLHGRELAHQALRQSEERFARAFHMAPVPMAILALDGLRMLDVNDAFTAASGWRREELLGRSEPGMAMWGDGEPRRQLEHQLRGGGEVRGVDVRFRNRNGAVGDYLLSADIVSIHDERCVLTVMQDITERKRTEAELLQAVQAAMQDGSIGHRIVEKLAAITASRRPAPGPAVELDSLPVRAREVLDLLAAGLSDPRIAARLGIARNTLRNHIAVIYRRLGMNKRSAVVVWARERGLGTSPKPRTVRAGSGGRSSR